MALMLFLTKSTSTSEAYLETSQQICFVNDGDKLFKFAQQRINIIFSRESNHDIHLLYLNIQWVIILAEENSHFI
jgi:hypothetical protein